MAAPEVLIGTSGYAFDDWTGPFYPPRMAAKKKLGFYVERFAALELNASFYRLPDPAWMEDLAGRVPPHYPVVVKAYRGITHCDGTEPEPLPRFRDALAPLTAAGKLGAVLVQYPQRVHNHTANRTAMLAVVGALTQAALPVVVEFRHRSWDTEAVRRLLRERGASWVAVDMPELPDLPQRSVDADAPLGFVRFHGRNSDTWYGDDGSLRYDYSYRDDELLSWVPAVRDWTAKERRIFLFFNNCHRAQSVASARRMSELLVEAGLAAPLPEPPPLPEQQTLF
jgi:uncharacterized protein YecE (DUF72 family)